MVAPTVIDGKIYVGNDYGAIYCISDIAGPEPGDEGEIKLGNGLLHWSWLILFAIVAVAFVILYRMY
jgi:iron complex transport system permease protein